MRNQVLFVWGKMPMYWTKKCMCVQILYTLSRNGYWKANTCGEFVLILSIGCQDASEIEISQKWRHLLVQMHFVEQISYLVHHCDQMVLQN